LAPKLGPSPGFNVVDKRATEACLTPPEAGRRSDWSGSFVFMTRCYTRPRFGPELPWPGSAVGGASDMSSRVLLLTICSDSKTAGGERHYRSAHSITAELADGVAQRLLQARREVLGLITS